MINKRKTILKALSLVTYILKDKHHITFATFLTGKYPSPLSVALDISQIN